MDLRIVVLFSILFTSIAAFKIPAHYTHLNKTRNLDTFSYNKENRNDFCAEVCGYSSGVLCEGDRSNRDNTRCSCKDKSKIFLKLDKECTDCRCSNGKCVKDNRGKTKCNCKRGYALQDENTCARCDCGKMGKCMFIPLSKSAGGALFMKKCLCDLGSAEKNGVCVDCHCGENSKCEFEDDEKICYCIDGYAEKEGVCTKCDCGEYGECTFDKGHKVCTCDSDFEEINGVCVDKCENYGCKNDGACEVDDGKPSCTCHERYFGTFCENDKCDTLNCQNEGNCVIENDEAVCECNDMYEGKECEIDKCSTITCYNDGKCVIEKGRPVCYCPNGYFGESCEKDACSQTTCYNNGECYMDYGKASCKCLVGFEGEFCEKDLCSYHPCENGGKCVIEGGKPVCECTEFYEGEHCKTHKCSYVHCQNDGKCVIKDSKAVCECTIKYTGENCEKVRCSSYYPCQNGGKCNDEVCYCLSGTSGELCDIIDECPNLCPKRPDINCTYDIKHERAYCECLDRRLGFHQYTQECRRTCEEYECHNGGACEEMGYSRFCKCLEGTKGDLCEDVPGCYNIDCGNEATCQFDIYKQTALCQCHNKELVLDQEDRRCKKPCMDSSDCFNGGECISSGSLGYCLCLDGTKGDYCEEVPGCNYNQCGDNAECIYDVERRIATCKCIDENFSFDTVDFRCKKRCYSSDDCLNGGTCSDDDSNKFCRCLDGTNGDFCEEIPGCKDIECSYDSKCVYDETKKTPLCQCDDQSLAYDVISKICNKPCVDDSVCQNEGLCMYRGYNRFCHCKEGTSGYFCEDIDVCNEKCGYAENVACKYDVEQKIAECICKDENYEFDADTKSCKRCDCGGKEISCLVRDGKKICVCPDGFSDKNGKCEKTSCTEKKCSHGRCEVRNYEEICTCYEGYYLDGDECIKKTCTETRCLNGTCVVRYGGSEECICPAGYTLKYDLCIKGACKQETCYGGECVTIDGELTCKCPEKFHLEGIGCYETVCEIQRCFGGKCVVEDGKEICTCKEGYILENDVCKKILCEKKNCFGGQCHIRDGVEDCECPAGYTIFEDVCVRVNEDAYKEKPKTFWSFEFAFETKDSTFETFQNIT